MATPVFTLSPLPHWVIIDNFSKLPNGAAIYTYRSLAPSTFKPAFQDAAGLIPYDQPIVGFGNGTMPAIYWEFDPNNPSETYYIRVYDSANPTTQNFLWDANGISGSPGGGGGTIIVTNNDIENLVINGQFYKNIGNFPGTPSLPTFILLAPSNHDGFVGTLSNLSTGPASPDIIFAKNVTTSSDSISFTKFSPLGINALNGDTTPVSYLNYTCTVAGAGESYKYVQFPISKDVQNLANQTVSIKIWARCNNGNTNLTLSFRLFFGDGGSPSPDLVTLVSGGPLPLTNAWQVFTFSSVLLPSPTGANTIGSCGNDGLFLQVGLPLGVTTNIDFVKPAIYLGPVVPMIDFHSYDQTDSIINSPRTGDTRTSLNDFEPYGWVNMNDGTIGSDSSNASARKNIDTFPLFDLIWRSFNTPLSSQSFAPMFTSGGVPIAYGASSIADFTANNAISLTRNLGRVMAGALPIQTTLAFTTPIANTLTVSSVAVFRANGVPVTVSSSTVPQLVNSVTYYVRILSPTTISLHSIAEGAIGNTSVILFPGNGALGGNIILAAHALGQFLGEETHTLSQAELPAVINAVTMDVTALSFTPGGTPIKGVGAPGSGQSASTNFTSFGSGAAHNNMQPTVFMNVFIKL